jgi:opacity protein-like surface antigen
VTGLLNGTEARAAWVGGGGVEFAFSRYLGWKTEYLYVETGAVTNTTATLPTGEAYSTHRIIDQMVRTGINFHF